MTLLNQSKLILLIISMQFPRNGRQFEFGGHFGSYSNHFKSETFLMPNKKNLCRLLQEIILCRCLKKIFLNQIAAILELADIASLKQKIREGNIPGITEFT